MRMYRILISIYFTPEFSKAYYMKQRGVKTWHEVLAALTVERLSGLVVLLLIGILCLPFVVDRVFVLRWSDAADPDFALDRKRKPGDRMGNPVGSADRDHADCSDDSLRARSPVFLRLHGPRSAVA